MALFGNIPPWLQGGLLGNVAGSFAPPEEAAAGGLFGRLSQGISDNPATLMALGAGIMEGGFGAGLQGALAGSQLDRKTRLTQQQQLATWAALKARGLSDADATAAVANPDMLKALLNVAVPEYKPVANDQFFGSFNPGSGQTSWQGAVPKLQTIGDGQSAGYVTPPMPGRAPVAGRPSTPGRPGVWGDQEAINAGIYEDPNAKPAAPAQGGFNSRFADAGAFQPVISGGPKFEHVTTLRKEFLAQPGPTKFLDSSTGYASMLKSASMDSPASDLDMVYGLAKLLDPGSVVREGEFATVQKSNSIPEQIKGQMQFLLEGKGRLTPAQREQVMMIARNRLESYREQANGDVVRYRDLAKRNKIDPDQVTREFDPVPIFKASKAAGAIDTPSLEAAKEEARRRMLMR